MQGKKVFDILFLIGRPAAGKSEIIDFLKQSPAEIRSERFHIGDFTEIDDFPMLWTWFEEDDILTRSGRHRMHTDDQGYFKDPFLWHLLIQRLELDYWKFARDTSGLGESRTVIIEFARGMEHGGFREAFSFFTDQLLRRGAVMYIDVPFEESLRKNRRRFNPDKPDSILEHGLSDEKLTRLYKDSDWQVLSSTNPEYLQLGNNSVPYAIFSNNDDVTTGTNPALGPRLEETLTSLWERYQGTET